MKRSRILFGLGTAVAAGVALVAGIALGDALADDPTLPSATPPEAPPMAIAAPDDAQLLDADGEPAAAVDGEAPAELDLGPDGTPPPRTAAVLPHRPARVEHSAETEALLALADQVAARAEAVAAGEEEPEVFEPPEDADGVTDDSPLLHTPDPLDLLGEPAEDVPDFVDLCAGPTPGEVPEGDFGCPEVGVAGTVLALESDPATEMGVGLEFVTIATGDEAQRRHNPGQVPWGACDWSELPAGRIPVYVLTTRPADVVVEHGAPGRPAGTVEAGPEPGRLRVIQLTLDDEGSEMDPRIWLTQVCTDVPSPDGGQLELTVTATDTAGTEISHTFTAPVAGVDLDFTEPTPRPTPPPPPPPEREAEIHAIDGRVLRIVAPQDDPRRERVFIATVVASGPDATGETCSSIQQSVFEGERRDPRLFNWEVTPRITAPNLDPWEVVEGIFGVQREPEVDPNEGLGFQTVTMMSGVDGITYDICVWWTGRPQSESIFAPRPVIEQRQYRVSAPDLYQVEVLIEEILPWRRFEPWQFDAEIFGQRQSFPAEPMGSSTVGGEGSTTSRVLDRPLLVGRAWDPNTPTVSDLTITNNLDGSTWSVMLGTRTRPCDGSDPGICVAGVSTSRLVELPMGSAQAMRCLGNGCPDGPGRGNQAGWIRVRVVVSDPDGGDPPNRNSTRWRIGGGEDFHGAPRQLPDAPRLDLGLTRILDQGGPDRPSGSIRGTVAFDRPVTGEIQVDAVLAHDPAGCDRPPITIGPEPRTVVPIFLDGLCRDALYSFPTTVVDADGTEASFPGVVPLAGATNVLNVKWSFALQVTAVHVDDRTVSVESGGFTFDDKSAPLDTARCVSPSSWISTTPNRVRHLNEDSLVLPTFTVGATFHLREGCGDPDRPAHTETWEVELNTDLLEYLFRTAGRTQTLQVAVEGEVIDYTVQVEIQQVDALTCREGFCPRAI